jgi:hypothetical protein
MRPGFEPTRRNRNIGTAKRGHGADNKMRIPSVCGLDRIWWEQIRGYDFIEKIVANRTIRFIVEHPREGSVHACSPEMICALLELIPSDDWLGIDCFVFRQSTRKQWLLNPVWGRLAMHAEIGQPGKPNIYAGPAVLLEASDFSAPITWSRSLDPESAKELERLRDDGHTIVEGRRDYSIWGDLIAVQATQLYRTVLHETGHWVDWLEKVERPSRCTEGSYSTLSDAYWARPSSEREAFAHSYADLLRKRLISEGKIPLPEGRNRPATPQPLGCALNPPARTE